LYFSNNINAGVLLFNIHLNSHFTIVSAFISIASMLYFFLPTLISAIATFDFDNHFHEIIFSTPINKITYFWSKFLLSWILSILVYLGVILGLFLAWYFVEPHQLGENTNLLALFHSIIWYVIPNTFIICALTFSAAIYFRNIIATYVMVIVISLMYSIAIGIIGGELENRALASYFNPFGDAAFQIETQYWTVSDKNTKIYLPGYLMITNRVIWILISLLLIGLSFYKFSFSKAPFKFLPNIFKNRAIKINTIQTIQVKTLTQFGFQNFILSLFARAKIEYLLIVRHISFFIMAGIGLGILCVNLFMFGRNLYGTHSLPVSYIMSDLIMLLNVVFGQIIVIFFAGQMIWADRNQKTVEISNSLPTKNITWLLSKIFALVGVVYTLQIVAIIFCIAYQCSQGYYAIDFEPYLMMNLFIFATTLSSWAVLSITIQVLSNNMALGYLICAIIFFLPSIFGQIGLNHFLFSPWSNLHLIYSDMNKLAPFMGEVFWFKSYQFLISIILVLVSLVFWIRGLNWSFMIRLKFALMEAKKLPVMISFVMAFLFISATGAKIYYDTCVINKHETNVNAWKDKAVEYEKKYKKFEKRPQPRVTNALFEIELYPSKEQYTVKGDFTLVNKHKIDLDTLHINYPEKIDIEIFIPNAIVIHKDTVNRYMMFLISDKLKSGDSTIMHFEAKYAKKAIENWVGSVELAHNGTFINKASFSPSIGYSGIRELYDKWDRKKYGLAEKEIIGKEEDSLAKMQTYISLDGDFGKISATIGTEIDQIAIAPGDLTKKQIKNNRAYFTYQSNENVLQFYSFCSARYQVAKENWNGIDLEVYHHKGHERNVPTMLKAMKNAISFCSKNYSSYKHKQARIIEFPRYQQFAQAFPGTMPYSESMGFIMDIDPKVDIDFVYYVVSHEIAHQWWGHQVAPANVEGCTFMVESMAQYTALQIMEKEYGSEKMKKFLKYEMDTYLMRRGFERNKELPMIKNQHQDYIYYQKGSVIMYALGKYIGFEKINMKLREFIKNNYQKTAPYPTAQELYKQIKSAVPDSLKYLAEDMFEKIVLYDNKTTDAVYEKLPNGKYRAYFTVQCAKLSADSLGLEKVLPLVDFIEIAITNDKDSILRLERVKLTKEKTDFIWETNTLPEKAAIDPNYLLIDRVPVDNYKKFKKVRDT
jgi:hypothetical protein